MVPSGGFLRRPSTWRHAPVCTTGVKSAKSLSMITCRLDTHEPSLSSMKDPLLVFTQPPTFIRWPMRLDSPLIHLTIDLIQTRSENSCFRAAVED
ncbi:hypothetical protein M5689_016529 [Euphorbia peplus]|nr:hypothetical protein M5689_016529 [Euphorbia peplus]